jgi:hypothetical protein
VAKVTDPDGVQWSVDRSWIFVPRSGTSSYDAATGLVLPLLLLAFWPFWFPAHWLGLAWVIEIERGKKGVGREKVRGWGKSQRRIQEIAESAATGTLRPDDDYSDRLAELSPPPRTELYLYDMARLGWSGTPIARLELTDQAMRCTIKGQMGYARWLSERLAIPDLKKRLKDGQLVTVFEFPRYGCDIAWPNWNPPGTCFQVRHGNTPVWALAFTKGVSGSEYQRDFAGPCQQWRLALAPPGPQPR